MVFPPTDHGSILCSVGVGACGAHVVPSLDPGESFTYHASGIYDGGCEETVVIASRNASGYLFAGSSPPDLVEEVVWGRDWFGTHTLGLDPTDGTAHYLDFPLARVSRGSTTTTRA